MSFSPSVLLGLPHVETDKSSGYEETNSNTSVILSVSVSSNLWLLPLFCCSTINVVMILLYEVYILFRSSQVSSRRRHSFLSQMLLLGLLLGSVMGFVFTVTPNNPVSCVAIRLGTGLTYVIIYSSLLVKLVFIISLNTGIYLPINYQALLFFFCILVQIVIDIQWISSFSLCEFTTSHHLFSLFYIVFLIVFVTGLAFKSRNIKDNYRY